MMTNTKNLMCITHFQALLSLGASPDYRDRCGLTPLYHSVLTGGDTSCCETLLYYRAQLGVRDENGWDESHQVCVTSLKHKEIMYIFVYMCACMCPFWWVFVYNHTSFSRFFWISFFICLYMAAKFPL